MSIEELIKNGSIHQFKATQYEVDKAIEIAQRDLAQAERLLGESLDWCYSIAYNAVLQACRAYMFHLGYRPASGEAHKATFEFMHLVMDEPLKESLPGIDRVEQGRSLKVLWNALICWSREAEKPGIEA